MVLLGLPPRFLFGLLKLLELALDGRMEDPVRELVPGGCGHAVMHEPCDLVDGEDAAPDLMGDRASGALAPVELLGGPQALASLLDGLALLQGDGRLEVELRELDARRLLWALGENLQGDERALGDDVIVLEGGTRLAAKPVDDGELVLVQQPDLAV